LETLAQRYGVLDRRRAEILHEWEELRQALVTAMIQLPEPVIVAPGGRYRVVEREGVGELVWEPEK
jgi:hypothetical protein